MSEREWFPAEWVDEVCPPSKATPDAFIVKDGDGWLLGYGQGDTGVHINDADLYNQPLEVGDVVSFVSCDRYDDIEATLKRDGSYQLHGALPPDHNTIIVDGDIDTLHEGFEALIAALKAPGDEFHISNMIFPDGLDENRVTLSFARWSDPLPHRFVVEDGKPAFHHTQIN
jgi:hypothetical protein